MMECRLHCKSENENSRGSNAKQMPRVIVATDGSPAGNRAVDAAARLAKATGSDLVILTVGGNISGAELRRLAGVEGDLSEVLESAAKQILDRARKRPTSPWRYCRQIAIRMG